MHVLFLIFLIIIISIIIIFLVYSLMIYFWFNRVYDETIPSCDCGTRNCGDIKDQYGLICKTCGICNSPMKCNEKGMCETPNNIQTKIHIN